MDTKEYILTNITQLFNRQGFTNTSLRQAAAYLDMSDGNLRYHFKDKEALVMDLFKQMRMELTLAMSAEDTTRGDGRPEHVREEFRAIFFTMYRYKFLFVESNLLIKQYASFRRQHATLRKQQKAYYKSLLSAYIKADNPDSKLLFEQLYILSDSWIKYVDLEEISSPISIDAKIDHYVDLCLRLLKPVLLG
jgi:AcrR family transcriptional regulator